MAATGTKWGATGAHSNKRKNVEDEKQKKKNDRRAKVI